jgi:hypothetical protein
MAVSVCVVIAIGGQVVAEGQREAYIHSEEFLNGTLSFAQMLMVQPSP